MRDRIESYSNIIILSMLAIGSMLFIELNYRYWYSFMEQYMMFRTTSDYLMERLAEPGGLNQYIAEFISLPFIYPFGASPVISLLLVLIAILFNMFLKGCGFGDRMSLAIFPSLLFWIFPQESVALQTMLLLVLISSLLYINIYSDLARYIVGLILIVVCYLLATPASLLLAMLMAFHEISKKNGGKRWPVAIAILAFALLLPLMAMRTIYIMPMREAFVGKHLCHPEYPIPTSIWCIILSFPLLSLILLMFRKKRLIKGDMLRLALTTITLLVATILAIYLKKDPLEQAYRYDYLARQERWSEIVSHASANPVRDMDALIYQNLALSKCGLMATDLTRFPQIGVEGLIPHNPKSRLGLIEACEVAWQVGQVNASQRFAFVGVLSSERLVQPRLMKRLVESYLVNGEYRAAEKYIKILETTPHYADWASEQRRYLKPDASAMCDWIAEKRAMLPLTDNPFDLTLTFPNAIAFLIDDHADNRPALEYGMAYLLIHKDLMTFMHYMELMRDRGEKIPKLYQEAICLFYSAVNRDPEAFKKYAIDDEVMNRFARFLKVFRSMPPASLKGEFGDTYYYYAQFMPTPKQR